MRSVSFSEKDPYEMALLQHSEQFGAFSTYVKRLIQRDFEGGRTIPVQHPVYVQPVETSVPVAEVENMEPYVQSDRIMVPPPKEKKMELNSFI